MKLSVFLRLDLMALLFLLVIGLACSASKDSVKLDLAVINGKIWTGDPANPRVEAVGVVDNKVYITGSSKDIKKLVGEKTKLIDLNGRFASPGFIDSHVHFVDGGFYLLGVDLRDAGTKEEFRKRIAEKAKQLPKGAWILGGDWDHELWGGKLPEKEWIDAVTPNNPVFVNRYDGHMSLANSLAIKLAGVTKKTKTPQGGQIIKNRKGEPAGVFKDAAMGLISAFIPEHSEEELTLAVEAALEDARIHGVTTVHDVNYNIERLEVYDKLNKQGRLTCRIYGTVPLSGMEKLDSLKTIEGLKNEFIKLGGVKAFADGSLGSTTAMFFEPYEDEPDTKGILMDLMFPLSKTRERFIKADKAGYQIFIHAIGDSAISLILDIFEEVEKENGKRDSRHRIEHSQHMHPKDYKRYADMNVIASMQPYHAIDDGRWAEKRIGPERCKNTYAFRTFLDNNVKLAFGSDWSVAPMDPVLGLYAAVTRRTIDGKNPDGWYPEQKISVEEAMKGYTTEAAYAGFEENIKGDLSKGKLADIVILSESPFDVSPEKIKDIKIDFTIVDGKVVYERKQ